MYNDFKEKINENPPLKSAVLGVETLWINPKHKPFLLADMDLNLGAEDIAEADARLHRFAPFFVRAFPETALTDGLIESPLSAIPNMQGFLEEHYGVHIDGQLLIKLDSHLPIAGSVKARGGIYEILCHTEKLALAHGIIVKNDSYAALCEHSSFFSKYQIHVGSTGNLGLSIGIISAKIGYQVTVHMSREAKAWKKQMLREHGVTVLEYDVDFSAAVTLGRQISEAEENSHFVDDENSTDLFMGYAVAAEWLRAQLELRDITVDDTHPLFVYLPCGVGGAPGGITFGLKHIFGDNVHSFFVEPTQCPSMLFGMASSLHDGISVNDVGLSGITHADGLAVSRPSKLVGKLMDPLLSGIFTISDYLLYNHMRELYATENIFIEPSAAAAFAGPIGLESFLDGRAYIESCKMREHMENATHIVWATGGNLVPSTNREEFLNTYL